MTRILTAVDGPLKGRGIQLSEGAEVVEVRRNARGVIVCIPRPTSKLGKVIGYYRPGPDGAVWEAE